MRVLVTGATGMTGSAVAQILVGGGATVIGVSRHGSVVRSEEIEHVAGDCANEEIMSPLLARCDALVHVAGILSATSLARMANLRRPVSVVVVSTASVHSRFRASAGAYLAGEQALRAARPDAIVIRPTMIYGSERDRNVHHVLDFADRFGFLPLFGSGSGLLQPIHVADLAHAICQLTAGPSGLTVEAGGGSSLTIRDAGRAIFTALGRKPRFTHVPMPLALTSASVVDRVRGGRLAERLRRMDEDRVVDNTVLIETTKVRPREFAEGVQQQAGERKRASR